MVVVVETWRVKCGWNPEFMFDNDDDAFRFAKVALEALDNKDIEVEISRIEEKIIDEVDQDGEDALEEAE